MHQFPRRITMANKQPSKPTTTTINKSASTGKIVSAQYAKTHPATTYAHTIQKPSEKKK